MEDRMKLASESDFENNPDIIVSSDADEDIHYWLYSPGEQADKWDEFYEQGIMAIGWYDLGSLNRYGSKQEIKDRLQELYGTSSKNDALALWEFCNEMEKGDMFALIFSAMITILPVAILVLLIMVLAGYLFLRIF